MIDLRTMPNHTTFESWVSSWPKEELQKIRVSGYDEWEGKPDRRSLRTIYIAYKHDIWAILRDHTGGDVTSYLFDDEGYLANTEAELFDILVGCAIEVVAGRVRA